MHGFSPIQLAFAVFLFFGPDYGYADPARTQSGSTPAFEYMAEGRGVWIASVRNVNWDSTMATLKEAGYNMVFPNMCTGGVAYYPSAVLPMRGERDELALCLKAAHKNGIEVHVWRINWNMTGCPESFNNAMVRAGRIQYSYEGKRTPQMARDNGKDREWLCDWLCPSNAENRKLEKKSMLELVRKYDVDGVHFDFMRYGWPQVCYCDTCKKNFAERYGVNMSGWPKDFYEGGKYYQLYQDWRRELITSSAREIARAVHTLDPYVCVSLAARSGISWARKSDAQEWWNWSSEGILDFICPMNYTTDPDEFVKVLQSHLPLIKGRLPYYSGLGAYRMKTFEQMRKNIEIGRELGQDGFVAFEISSLLPHLDRSKMELTGRKALLPHRAPETHYRFSESERQSPDGFPVYAPGKAIGCSVSVMFKGKLREGIERIRGDFTILSLNEDKRTLIRSVDLDQGARIELTAVCHEPGRYRLALYGSLILSTAEERPFIAQSFPFEVKSY